MSPIYSNWKKKNIYFLQQWENNPHIVLFHCCSCDLKSSNFLQKQNTKKKQMPWPRMTFFMTLVFLEWAKMKITQNYDGIHFWLDSTAQSQYRPPSTYHIHKNNAIKQTSASEANLLLASINNPVVNIHTDFWWCPYCANLIVLNLRWWGFALITWLDDFFPPLTQPNTSSLLWLHVN